MLSYLGQSSFSLVDCATDEKLLDQIIVPIIVTPQLDIFMSLVLRFTGCGVTIKTCVSDPTTNKLKGGDNITFWEKCFIV